MKGTCIVSGFDLVQLQEYFMGLMFDLIRFGFVDIVLILVAVVAYLYVWVRVLA